VEKGFQDHSIGFLSSSRIENPFSKHRNNKIKIFNKSCFTACTILCLSRLAFCIQPLALIPILKNQDQLQVVLKHFHFFQLSSQSLILESALCFISVDDAPTFTV
jgi:hypothetical protein